MVVNTNDEPIGAKKRCELDYNSDIYRASGIWITSPDGFILMAQRSFKKDKSPGKWGPAAAGTVGADETYLDNAVKELTEEIGISVSPEQLRKGPKEFKQHTEPVRHLFVQWYFLTLPKDTPFVLQEEEVERVQWFSETELREAIKCAPEQFLTDAERNLAMFSNNQEK